MDVAAFEVTNLADTAGALVSLAAIVGLILLLPLYFSQRRDLKRLVLWMEQDPGHPREDAQASETILDRAEVELEQLTAESEPIPSPVAQRVTSERPALERITMERAALLPHPRWRRFVTRVTQPKWLVAIAVAAMVLAVAGIYGSDLLLQLQDKERTPRAGAVEPGDVDVAVLNGTTVTGLGAKVGDDVKANGYQLGAVTTITDPFDQTLVMFEEGQERAARSVARDLGGVPVQPIDRQAQRLADGAAVVVIAGQDRAGG